MALEFGENPEALMTQVLKSEKTQFVSQDLQSLTQEYNKIKHLRPKVTVEKKIDENTGEVSKQLKVTGLTGLN